MNAIPRTDSVIIVIASPYCSMECSDLNESPARSYAVGLAQESLRALAVSRRPTLTNRPIVVASFAIDQAGLHGKMVHGRDHGRVVALGPFVRVMGQEPDAGGRCL